MLECSKDLLAMRRMHGKRAFRFPTGYYEESMRGLLRDIAVMDALLHQGLQEDAVKSRFAKTPMVNLDE